MDASRSRRRRAPFLIGLLAILTALPVGYFLFLHEAPAPAPVSMPAPAPKVSTPPPAPEPPRLVELKLQEIRGTVEVRRGGGEWRGASVGEALRASDAVRTLAGSYAVLIGGEAVEVRMEPGTEVTVAELTDTLSRLLLGKGMTTMRVRSSSGAPHALELTATGSDAVARSQGGAFTVSNNGAGTVALATLEGETTLSGQQRSVVVLAGQQSVVRPGQAPSAPAPIPASLLLKVNWPDRPRRQILISGQTEPGTQVLANGEGVLPDAQGRFSFPLTLKEGSNPVRVQVRSVGGLRQEEQRALQVDTTPPKAVTVDPGLWNDPAPPPP
ncbi:hypothetical protein [Cystobacter ferrugineus]|uniref:FecR protein domain-containing protein n=1 Tax=Cystobacter ferrugineus TaxID=83449 RepID=A0A1L9B444_9BACT|nr:hypothetical protein [Cystobacter ferrugineus]OJH37045.1 hypothetical protein BON30_31680 [Cystobacter ferrugineus]